jgi:hypothetical protein
VHTAITMCVCYFAATPAKRRHMLELTESAVLFDAASASSTYNIITYIHYTTADSTTSASVAH